MLAIRIPAPANCDVGGQRTKCAQIPTDRRAPIHGLVHITLPATCYEVSTFAVNQSDELIVPRKLAIVSTFCFESRQYGFTDVVLCWPHVETVFADFNHIREF
jgi:hypothetical protein